VKCFHVITHNTISKEISTLLEFYTGKMVVCQGHFGTT